MNLTDESDDEEFIQYWEDKLIKSDQN
jgi:hypothetical protein